MDRRSFAVVIPMFNEEAGADACVRAVCMELGKLPQRSRLIAVNDGSKDRTGEILSRLAAAQPCLSVVQRSTNSGYGAALRTGIEHAARDGYDYVLFMDSDLTNNPSDIGRFADKMDGSVDLIKATRYSHGGRVTGVPFYRVAISACGNFIARLLFGLPVHDCTNGFRAGKVSLFMRMNLSEKRFPIIMEELYWCKFLAKSYAEIPVVLTNRGRELRRTSFTYRPSVFYNYLKYPVRSWLGIRPAVRLKAA